MLQDMHQIAVASSMLASSARVAGAKVGPLGKRPAEPLELYEFEACPFCRKAREALTILDLTVRVMPCPKRGRHYRPWVIEAGGKRMFPYLVDVNTGISMYESDDIVEYLFRQYGAGPPPLHLRLGPLTAANSMAVSLWRGPNGAVRRGQRAEQPERPLKLWSFEWSPYSRLVRERLCELELPYVLHNLAKNSPSRAEFRRLHGKVQVPYLEDPNTGARMFESADIIDYLDRIYE